MLRFIRYILLTLLVLVLAVGAAAFLLQDANRFRPELEALIAEQTGVAVAIQGDLRWSVWPPVSLHAASVSADDNGRSWQIGEIAVHLDAWNALRDPEQWHVDRVTLLDAELRDGARVLTIEEARLESLAPNRPAPFAATLGYVPAADEPSLPIALNGTVTVDPAQSALTFDHTRIDSPQAAGTCDVSGAALTNPVRAPDPGNPADPGPALVPIDALLGYRWEARCLLDRVDVDGERFEQVTLTTQNGAAGTATLAAGTPRFFGGSADVRVLLDASTAPMRWTVTPNLTGVDSQALLTWLGRDLRWAAPLAYGGTLTFEGNSRQQLLDSMSGTSHFDGGTGRLDIAAIRSQLLVLAALFKEEERIQGWPEIWHYQRFIGDWRIDRQHHLLDLTLDNLALTGEGDYRPASGEIDMMFELVFSDDPAWPVFDLDPILYGLPIPVRCRGALADPRCQLDQKAAQRIVGQALAGGSDSGLRAKLEARIDRDVPEAYRDAARTLLDALGGALDRVPPEN